MVSVSAGWVDGGAPVWSYDLVADQLSVAGVVPGLAYRATGLPIVYALR